MTSTRQRGFTLIELMITVAVVGILAAIAYPSYTQYIVRGNRSAAQSFMANLTSKQEQYLLDARQYATTLTLLGYTSANIPAEVSRNYSITFNPAVDNTATPPTYTLRATPIGTQLSRDTTCGALTITQAGVKGITGSGTAASCW